MAYNPNNPNGQAASANSAPVVISSNQTSLHPTARDIAGVIITPAQQKLFRSTFAKTQAGVDSTFFNTIATGSGQVIAQVTGNLTIASGITANSETILRSTSSFTGNMITRIQTILSQRIVNQTFFLELVDVIGDGLVANATSATSLTVTIPNNPFTALNVGQSMYVGALAGGLVGVPNRYAIASVSGNDVTFTVAGFSVTTGTCSLFGWNYYHTSYSGATATFAFYDAQRNGWNSGDTTLGINTTAAPGLMLIMGNEDGNSWISDQLAVSSANLTIAQRGSRVANLPDESVPLYFQIRCLNGSVAPATTTTLIIGTASVENYATTPTSSYNVKPQGNTNVIPIAGAVTISNGVITSVGAVTTVGTVTTLANGQTAHSSASTGAPVRIGGRVNTTLDTTLIQGDACDAFMTTAGQQVQKPFGSAENDWQYAAVASGIVNTTTAVTIKAAGAASIRNYITGITIMAEALGAATELVIRDGAAGTVIFRTKIPATGLVTTNIQFPTPLKGTAATLLEVATLTASVTGAVYFNAQGYQSF
jgi:hypothetical protein